jgi:NitT/TauT family transport system permease protein
MKDIARSEAALGTAVSGPTVQGATDESRGILAARVVCLALFLAAWQGAVASGLANAAFISTPAAVAQSFWQLFETGEVLPHLATTLTEVAIAFALSVVLGVACAVVLDRHDRFNRVISPFLTAFNSMPRIALGPLFILWFGIGIASKVVLAFSLGFFIMLLSTLGGLKNVDRDLLLMSRLFGADEVRLFGHVRFPWALPSVFAGLKLTLIYCSAGAVIGEMIAARSGLGVLLQSYSGRFDVASVLALIFLVAILVMTSTSLLELVERRLLSWSKGSTDVP